MFFLGSEKLPINTGQLNGCQAEPSICFRYVLLILRGLKTDNNSLFKMCYYPFGDVLLFIEKSEEYMKSPETIDSHQKCTEKHLKTFQNTGKLTFISTDLTARTKRQRKV